MAEDPSGTLIPNGPRHKHGKRSHGFSMRCARARSTFPPILHGILGMPCRCVDVFKVGLLDDQVPKPNEVKTLEEEMCPAFGFPLAKGVKTSICPSPLGQLSAVQTRSWIANQTKNLTLGGAQTFQTMRSKGDSINPRNCALYAEAAE